MEELQLMWTIIKKTGAQHFVYSFILFYFVFCILIHFFDTDITSFGDALWLGFNIITTIGLGDYTVTSPIARILAAILGLYGTFFFALIPGIITSYYLEKSSQTKKAALDKYYDKLANARNLTDQEKREISQTVRRIH